MMEVTPVIALAIPVILIGMLFVIFGIGVVGTGLRHTQWNAPRACP
ncbi:MAG: hypothetical protein ACUVS4_02160 [Chloroflexaceae bacterium]